MGMGLLGSIRRFFRDAKVTEFYVKISKEEFQGNLHRASDICVTARQFVELSNLDEDERLDSHGEILVASGGGCGIMRE
jgi:hypothetical protein